MDIKNIVKKAEEIRKEILKDEYLKNDIDEDLDWIPKPYCNGKDIKLIIIGQDPTIKNPEARKKIRTVLNLDNKNSLYNYVNEIMWHLGLTIEDNLYATNFYKCFFTDRPARDEKILTRHFRYWLDLIAEELTYFPEAKVITLGEPLIEQLITNGHKKVSYYWDYIGKTTSNERFSFIEAKNNVLCRDFYALPHQPTYANDKTDNGFYFRYFEKYLDFCK